MTILQGPSSTHTINVVTFLIITFGVYTGSLGRRRGALWSCFSYFAIGLTRPNNMKRERLLVCIHTTSRYSTDAGYPRCLPTRRPMKPLKLVPHTRDIRCLVSYFHLPAGMLINSCQSYSP